MSGKWLGGAGSLVSGQTTLEVVDGNPRQTAVSYCQSRPIIYLMLEGSASLLLGAVPRQVGDMVLVLEVLCVCT